MNLYGFVGNDGVNRNDILGLLDAKCSESECCGLLDITDKLNEKITNEIRKAGSLASIRDRLGKDIQHSHSKGLTNIDGWIQDQGDKYCKSGDSRPLGYKWASCVKITCGGSSKCIGADKISHFFQQGYMLYEVLTSKSREHAIAFGAASEGLYDKSNYSRDVRLWINYGEFNFHDFSEYRVHMYKNKWGNIGGLGGAISKPAPGDQAANVAGMDFWEKLASEGSLSNYSFDLCKFVGDINDFIEE